MDQPIGFIKQGKEQHVHQLKKSLYHLKVSPKCWYKRFDDHVIKVRFLKNNYDNYVYMRNVES